MLRHGQLNVQQQNTLVEKSIGDGAIHWRREPIPQALRNCGEERGVVWEKSIVGDLKIDFPGMPRLFGLLVTQDERIVAFEIDTDSDHQHVNAVATWKDVTAAQDLSLHNRGTSVGRGALALRILRALNAGAAESPPLW